MNVAPRLALFGVALGAVFGGAALAGAAFGPVTEDRPAGHETAMEAHGSSSTGGAGLSGLAVTEGGYALEADGAFFVPGQAAPFTFRITDGRGLAVRDEFEVEHEKELHLIVVRRDTSVFRHLHPQKGSDGTWSVELNLPEPGTYRAYADFKIDGQKRTLATDLFVPGDFQPRPLPAPQAAAPAPAVDSAGSAAEGLEVSLEAPEVRAGSEVDLAFTVTRGGQPFSELEPYLGAKGHLVALREGDLAYLHVHPIEAESEHAPDADSTGAHGNEIGFGATFPTPGRYRLFLQFQTGGDIRTVSYTVEVPR